METLLTEEQQIGTTKALSFDFGETSQNVDQSVNYNFEGAGADGLNFFKSIPPGAMYAALAVAGIGLIVWAKKKK